MQHRFEMPDFKKIAPHVRSNHMNCTPQVRKCGTPKRRIVAKLEDRGSYNSMSPRFIALIAATVLLAASNFRITFFI
ncbi:hypothetical protein NXT3_PB00358 (plasmid) [Sinorhizobium fredii]|uniref:Transmembrane protein n=1 Tax=Rhizobium fredii TaxID=380 RepID=A0A2L0HC00_RHIFR|nr:hypothetical protein NXT3_PB00358 [Sinorhizobium fredii]